MNKIFRLFIQQGVIDFGIYKCSGKSVKTFLGRTLLTFLLCNSVMIVVAKTHLNNLALGATYSTVNVSVCGNGFDGSIIVTPGGGVAPYTYSWTGITGPGGNIPFSAGNLSTLTGLQIGYYNVEITDAALNSITISNIHIGFAFAISITNSGSISSACGNTGSIILYGNAGIKPYLYSLDGITYQAGNTFLNLAAGNYTAYMKDFAGCVSTKSISVLAVAPVTVTSYVQPASSCSNDGVLELYRSGGIPPYTYSLNNITYQTSNIFSGLQGGTVVTGWVKDSKGCIGSLPGIIISQGAGLNVTLSKTNTSSCINDGTIQFNVSGGFAPYTFSLDDITFQNGNSFSGLRTGNYLGFVRDSRGCKGVSYTTIGLNQILVTGNSTNATNCVSNNGTIQLFHTGGSGSYTYSLDGNSYQYGNTFTGLAAGTYTGYVKDVNICIGVLYNILVGPVCVMQNNNHSSNK